MTISCPSCGSSYRIDREALGAGRRVRCARCRVEWFAEGTGPTPEVRLGPYELPEPIPGLGEADAIDAIDGPDKHLDPLEAVALPYRRSAGVKGRDPARQRGLRLFSGARPIAALAAIGIACCGALIGERTAIVHAAPSLASLYALVGLPVNVRGLEIENVRSVEQIEEGVPLLIVSGAVRNLSAGPLDVPRLRLAVTGGGERELYAWTTVAARAKLAPGETASFRARLASPPADGSGVAVRFLARRDLVTTASR